MSTWTVEYAERAEFDLEDIYLYIAETLLSPETAKKQLRRIMERIEKLDEMPRRFPCYDKPKWRKVGLRRMNVDNFAVFYLPDESSHTVNIIRILYSGRDIEEILR
ncbi:MAG: type II toxin-antitoxin system RelE/ParE family toxin [Clostridiales Family XIII bacterium]|jgi:toxin ParE1/3/4|nr:type II toxin-antitoxin system RelE/ParE family toxin [Clostridiales Family XIII bacterium]